MKNEDAEYMRLALQEAVKGLGRTSPNPCVGAVIVRNNEVIGRGYHRKAGTPHAEVNAIAAAGKEAAGATLYVTLEPCNHTGRTPPCTRAILDAKLARVVIGMPDPNPSVTGGGADYLLAAGIEVESGMLEKECRAINFPFIKHSTRGMPWMVMKAGMSLDGRISYAAGRGGRITGQESKDLTHSLRNTCDAILVGVETAIIDNPSLTTRLPDAGTGRDPLRIILDTNLRLPVDARMLRQESAAETWIYCGPGVSSDKRDRLIEAGAVVHPVELDRRGTLNLQAVLIHLGKKQVTSVLVEGGARIHGAMLSGQLVDEVYLFTAPFFIGDQGTPLLSGYSAPGVPGPQMQDIETRNLGEDFLVHGFLQYDARD